MATIGTAIEIYDRVSRPINSMIAALGSMCDTLESVDRSMDGTFDSGLIEQTRRKVEETAFEVIQLGGDTENAENKQREYNDAVRHGGSAMDGLIGKVGSLIGAYAGIQGVKKVLDLSDTMTQTTARLGMLVDGEEQVLALQKDIYEAAQRSRGSYQATADTVAKLGMNAGSAFGSTKEMVDFAEQLNKQFVIAGTDSATMQGAMTQLVQALGSGALRGDELNSIFEASPNLIQTIADYLEVPIGKIREMASEGQITADIVKNALLSSAEETNAKFEEMPLTFAQMGEMAKNYLLRAFEPVMQKISDLANNQGFQVFVSGLVTGLTVVSGLLLDTFDLVGQVALFFSDNWTIIEPIVWGIVAALGAYYAIMLLTNIINGVTAISEGVKAAATAMSTGKTFAATAAQHGYNAALMACPLTWILLMIIAVIAAIYAIVAAINKLTGSTISASGVICGAIMTAIAFIGNIFVGLWNLIAEVFVLIYNLIAEVANFIGNVFDDPIGSICRLFFGLADTVLGILQALASAIDAVFGSDLAGGIQGWRDSLGGWVDDTFGKGEEVMAKMSADDLKLDRFEYGEAWNSGYNAGENFEDSMSGFLDGLGGENIFDPDQYGGSYEASQIPSNIAATAENTGEMKDAMDITKEELKYLRDIAERDAINRFTTAEISVNMTNNNNISSEMDLDGMVDYLVIGVNEAMATAAEGVHT